MLRILWRLSGVGKIVPSYRMAVEWGIDRWKSFRNALPNEEEREAFDELLIYLEIWLQQAVAYVFSAFLGVFFCYAMT
jgi:hypothetical protein